jgi:hypothetical protein
VRNHIGAAIDLAGRIIDKRSRRTTCRGRKLKREAEQQRLKPDCDPHTPDPEPRSLRDELRWHPFRVITSSTHPSLLQPNCAIECAGPRAIHTSTASHRPPSATHLLPRAVTTLLRSPAPPHSSQNPVYTTPTPWAGSRTPSVGPIPLPAAHLRALATHAPTLGPRTPQHTEPPPPDTSDRPVTATSRTCMPSFATFCARSGAMRNDIHTRSSSW